MGKRRRKRAGFWLKGICLILLVPVFITTLMQRMRLENLIYGKEGAQEVLNTIDSVEGMEREVREHQENKKDILSGQAETQSPQPLHSSALMVIVAFIFFQPLPYLLIH